MAIYEYECKNCHHLFAVAMSFGDYDRHKDVQCPKCRSKSVERLLCAAHVQTSKKS